MTNFNQTILYFRTPNYYPYCMQPEYQLSAHFCSTRKIHINTQILTDKRKSPQYHILFRDKCDIDAVY